MSPSQWITKVDVHGHKRGRDLCNVIGMPSISDFKAILRMNMIEDNPVTTTDIDLAEKIFCPNIGSLQGKSTSLKPILIVKDIIKIPPMLIKSRQNGALCINRMKVNSLMFLTTTLLNLYYRTKQH